MTTCDAKIGGRLASGLLEGACRRLTDDDHADVGEDAEAVGYIDRGFTTSDRRWVHRGRRRSERWSTNAAREEGRHRRTS
jgi:hypothetical protein